MLSEKKFWMSLTFTNWPPDKSELLANETNIPDLFSKKRNVWKRVCILAPKLRVIKSSAQDINYSVNNKKHRTMKHTLFPLCIKRKTWSKEIVQWVNRFGHGMQGCQVWKVKIREKIIPIGGTKCRCRGRQAAALMQLGGLGALREGQRAQALENI